MFIERILHCPFIYYFKSGESKYLFLTNPNQTECLNLSKYGDIKLISFSEHYSVFVNESNKIHIISYYPSYNLTNHLNYNFKIIDVSCSRDHIVILTETRECFIINKLNNKDTKLSKLKLENVSKIVSGAQHTVFITNNVIDYKNNYKCFGLGCNNDNQLGYNLPLGYITEPTEIKINDKMIEDAYCGDFHTIFITSEMDIYGSGCNKYFQLGTENENLTYYSPLKIPNDYKSNEIINIYCDKDTTLFHMTDSTLHCIGRMPAINENTVNPVKITINEHDKFVAVSFNYQKLFVTTSSGENYQIGEQYWLPISFSSKIKFDEEKEAIIKFDDTEHIINNIRKFYLYS